jgi:hypothetical protein
MRQRARLSILLAFVVSVSLFGAFTTLLLALYPPALKEDFSWRKPLTGSIYALICMSGIMAVFFPKKCSETFHPQKTARTTYLNVENSDAHEVFITFKGHHPDCGKFSAHTIHSGCSFHCAACTGLLTGAIIALALTTPYFFLGLNIGQLSLPAVLAGELGLIFGFAQFRFKGYLRLVINAFFVLGTSLILIGVDTRAESVYVDLYSTGLIIFWLLTRILISQWDHWKIWLECGQYCETERKMGG